MGRRVLRFGSRSLGCLGVGTESRDLQALECGPAATESHVPRFQERVDTGTLFCPVVVASKGSSLNHSA